MNIQDGIRFYSKDEGNFEGEAHVLKLWSTRAYRIFCFGVDCSVKMDFTTQIVYIVLVTCVPYGTERLQCKRNTDLH